MPTPSFSLSSSCVIVEKIFFPVYQTPETHKKEKIGQQRQTGLEDKIEEEGIIKPLEIALKLDTNLEHNMFLSKEDIKIANNI